MEKTLSPQNGFFYTVRDDYEWDQFSREEIDETDLVVVDVVNGHAYDGMYEPDGKRIFVGPIPEPPLELFQYD